MEHDMPAMQRERAGKEVGENESRGCSMTCKSRSAAKGVEGGESGR